MLCMLLECICSYLKPFLRYKYSILDTYHLVNLYLCEQVLAIFRSQKGSASKQVWETLFYTKIITVLSESHTKHANALYGQNA